PATPRRVRDCRKRDRRPRDIHVLAGERAGAGLPAHLRTRCDSDGVPVTAPGNGDAQSRGHVDPGRRAAGHGAGAAVVEGCPARRRVPDTVVRAVRNREGPAAAVTINGWACEADGLPTEFVVATGLD